MNRIIVPRKKLYVPVRLVMGMKGFLRLQTINKFSGKITYDTGFFPNTLLDAGMNIMADRSDWMDECQVGTDNSAPNSSQTALLGWHAGITTVQSTLDGQSGSEPYYGWKRRVYRFAVGTVAANLSEAGIGWGESGSTLISRAQILDPITQTPVTITPLADELLDVTYELRYYPPLGDVAGPQVTLDGVVYDTTTRAANVTGDRWSDQIGAAMGEYSGTTGIGTDWVAYDGNIGTILTGPSGVSEDCDNDDQYNAAYSNNSYEIQMHCLTGSTGWNLGSGIRSIRFNTVAGAYQTQFAAASGGATIPKTSAYSMHMSWTLGWTEKV